VFLGTTARGGPKRCGTSGKKLNDLNWGENPAPRAFRVDFIGLSQNYPKDDTSGCTLEAQDFNGLLPAFAEADAKVVGLSPDPVKSHDKFCGKYGLAFPLAADEDKAVLEAYGVWVEKSMYGRKYMGVERTTVLVDREGRIAKIWPKVKVPGHAEAVLTAARALP